MLRLRQQQQPAAVDDIALFVRRRPSAMPRDSATLALNARARPMVASGYASRWWALAIVVAAQFMFVVDAFVANVALPSVRADLHATTGDMQGVLALYQIAFAVLVVAGGRLGDIYGSKTIFLAGLLAFTAASLWCGFAGSGSELVLARAGQGGAAALMIPQVLATIHRLFADAERGKAFGIFGFTLGFGAAVGFGLGGWLVAANLSGLGWRTVFFVNGPIGLALIVGALAILPPAPRKPGVRLDLLGTALLLGALLCLIGPLLVGTDLGWPSWLALPAAFGIALLSVFWRSQAWVETRGGLPLVHRDLIRDRGFAIGLVTVFLLAFANISFYLLITLYMQNQLRFTPLQSGATVVPLAIVFALVSRRAGPWAQKRGSRALSEGCGVAIAGLVVIIATVAAATEPAMLALAGVFTVFGAGQAMVMAPLYGRVLSKVPPSHAGSGAGVLSTVQQIGNASGVAVIGAIYFGLGQPSGSRSAVTLSLMLLAAVFGLLAAVLRERRSAAASGSVSISIGKPHRS
jgi:EmrB/QacA subfamily drug resistance transporter